MGITNCGQNNNLPENQLKILMVAACPFPWPRGTPTRIERLAETLTDLGHHVDVVTYHLGDKGSRKFQIIRTPNLSYYKKMSAGPSFTKLFILDPLLSVKILELKKARQYDLIHAHHIEGLLSALTVKMCSPKIPIIYDAHTLIAEELQDYGYKSGARLKKLLGSIFDFWLPRKADHIIAVTEHIKHRLINNRSSQPDNVSLITNGIEKFFIDSAQAARKNSTRPDKFDLEKDEIRFLFAGNMASYQGIDLMLNSFALVHQRAPKAKLIMASGEALPKEYLRHAKKLGIDQHVEVINVPLDHLPKTLANADVLLNPRTRCPGIPQKLINYMVCGRPVVSFMGSSKIVQNHVHALVVKDGDIEGFANAMLELIVNPNLSKELSQNALDLIRKKYRWKNSVLRSIETYKKTIEEFQMGNQ